MTKQTVVKNEFNKRNNLLYIAIYIIVFVVLSRLKLIHRDLFLWIQMGFYSALGIGGIYIYRELICVGVKSWKEHFWKNITWLLGAFVLDFLLEIIVSIPLGLINPEYESANAVMQSQVLGQVSPIILVIILGILGPITEEILYRVMLVHEKKENVPIWIAVISSAALFMLIHIPVFSGMEIVANLGIFTTGVVYSVVLMKTKNITIPIILHVFNNISAILLYSAMG